MPFDKYSATAAGAKGGKNRWSGKEPRTVRKKQIKINVSELEHEAITQKADETGLSLVDLILNSVNAYKPRRETANRSTALNAQKGC